MRIISIFDKSKNDKIDFETFLTILNNFNIDNENETKLLKGKIDCKFIFNI
jgi:Ca2+-binding EF-hand superfamily protein